MAVHTGPDQPRGRGRPSTLDREATLDATWRVIAERGLERTRYADVARATGTPVSTLQNAFGSLRALLAEAIHQASRRDSTFITDLPASGQATPHERLEALIVGALTEPDAFETWLVWLELWRAAARDQELAAHADEIYELWWSTAESIVADGQAAGAFTPDLPARDLAVALIAVLDGCAMGLLLRAQDPNPQEAARVAHLAALRLLAA